jgi:hypothetical protein
MAEINVAGLIAASTAETNTGSLTTKAVTPEALKESVHGRKTLHIPIVDGGSSLAQGDGMIGVPIESDYNGWEVVEVTAVVDTKGITGTSEFQLRRKRAGSSVDVLSTKVTLGDEFYVADGVINTSNDDVATGDWLYADTDQIHSGTAPVGCSLLVVIEKP